MVDVSANPINETALGVGDGQLPSEESRSMLPVPPAATRVAGDTDLPDDRYLNRELSWLDFNERVLALAEDASEPLLERAKFLAIFASNLDEFYMVRVAGLKRRAETGLSVRSADGLSPREQLARITARSQDLIEQHARVFLDEIRPALEKHRIRIVRWTDLDAEDQLRLSTYFSEQVFPVLTPLAVDPAHPFPYISGLSLNLAVVVRHPKTRDDHFARVKVPPTFGRFVSLGNQRFVPLEDVIGEHLKKLFPGMEVLGAHTFRVTRNEDLEVEEDDAENLLKALEKELLRRRFGAPVRLEVEESIDPKVLDLLVSELDKLETLSREGKAITGTPSGYDDLATIPAGSQPAPPSSDSKTRPSAVTAMAERAAAPPRAASGGADALMSRPASSATKSAALEPPTATSAGVPSSKRARTRASAGGSTRRPRKKRPAVTAPPCGPRNSPTAGRL